MTYDPSMTITSTIPAPEGSDIAGNMFKITLRDHPRPGGERQHQQRGQGHPPARDGGRQRFTRPGRTATRYGKDRWRYDL